MFRRILDSPALYFTLAIVLALAALLSQFEVHVPSRDEAPVSDLAKLRDRDDLNVVFLLVDTLRADRMGTYGYERDTTPFIDEAARYGIVFERTIAQSSWTKTSMASLWTGTHPVNNGIHRYNHVLPDEATLPAELFQQEGYRTAGIWRNGWVEPNFGFGQGFDVYVRPIAGAEHHRIHRESQSPNPISGTDEDMTISALDFIEQYGNERFFLYLHYMDLHQYVYDDESAIFGTSYSDVYDQSLRWTDRLVGVLFQALEERGILDRTLVVIGSDHGEAFYEHGSEGHAKNLYEEVTNVPFIVLPPMLLKPGVRVSETVSNVDLWPTVLDLVGLPELPGADGRPLLPLVLAAGGAAPEEGVDGLERPAFAQISKGWGSPKLKDEPMVAVTWQGKRLIRWLNFEDRDELYDHTADPTEQNNVVAERPAEVAALGALVDDYRASAENTWGKEPEEVELDEMRLNHLRALGYVIKP